MPDLPDTIDEAIAEAAKEGVSRVSVDGMTVDAMPIDQQIAAARFAGQQYGVTKNHFGLRIRRIEFGECG